MKRCIVAWLYWKTTAYVFSPFTPCLCCGAALSDPSCHDAVLGDAGDRFILSDIFRTVGAIKERAAQPSFAAGGIE